ncbi:MAG: hypothetical protein DSM106950_37075 [Stigonema ocellatum SAG 48.90 = DSM 106950]|nr:hypothetical protein [Stigonema ocellatum SAG 48.90 = DSM 106950]
MSKNKMRVKFVACLISSTVGILGIFSLPAWSIYKADCSTGNDYFTLWDKNNKPYCYGRPGNLPVDIADITKINSGNNYGVVTYYIGNPDKGTPTPTLTQEFCQKREEHSYSNAYVKNITLSASPPPGC